MPASFTSLPTELHLHISTYLSIGSFHSLQRTSRSLYKIYNFHTNTFLEVLTVRVNEFSDKRKEQVSISPSPKGDKTPPFQSAPTLLKQQVEFIDEQLLLKALMLDHYEENCFFSRWNGIHAKHPSGNLIDRQNLVYRFQLRLINTAILRFSGLLQLSTEEEKQALEALDSAISLLPPCPNLHNLYVPDPELRHIFVFSKLYYAILQTQDISCMRKLQQIPHFFPLPNAELLDRACSIGNLELVQFLLSKEFKFSETYILADWRYWIVVSAIQHPANSSLLNPGFEPAEEEEEPLTERPSALDMEFPQRSGLIYRKAEILRLLSSSQAPLSFDLNRGRPICRLFKSSIVQTQLNTKAMWMYMYRMLGVLLSLGVKTTAAPALRGKTPPWNILQWVVARAVRDGAPAEEKEYALPIIKLLTGSGHGVDLGRARTKGCIYLKLLEERWGEMWEEVERCFEDASRACHERENLGSESSSVGMMEEASEDWWEGSRNLYWNAGLYSDLDKWARGDR